MEKIHQIRMDSYGYWPIDDKHKTITIYKENSANNDEYIIHVIHNKKNNPFHINKNKYTLQEVKNLSYIYGMALYYKSGHKINY
jgi:hypothetical protein